MGTWVVRGALALFLLGVAGAAGFYGYFEAMKRGWVRYNEFDVRSEGILQVGNAAPELTLARVGEGDPVTLSSLYAERPVVLVFGSYT